MIRNLWQIRIVFFQVFSYNFIKVNHFLNEPFYILEQISQNIMNFLIQRSTMENNTVKKPVKIIITPQPEAVTKVQ